MFRVPYIYTRDDEALCFAKKKNLYSPPPLRKSCRGVCTYDTRQNLKRPSIDGLQQPARPLPHGNAIMSCRGRNSCLSCRCSYPRPRADPWQGGRSITHTHFSSLVI